MQLLTLIRHGQSTYNLENRFTGNIDAPLTSLGEEEAREAGKKIKNLLFNRAYTSEMVFFDCWYGIGIDRKRWPNSLLAQTETTVKRRGERNHDKLSRFENASTWRQNAHDRCCRYRATFSSHSIYSKPKSRALKSNAANFINSFIFKILFLYLICLKHSNESKGRYFHIQFNIHIQIITSN